MDKKKKGIIAGVTVGAALIAYLATRKAKGKPPALEISLSNLAITPTTVAPGDAVAVSVLVTNNTALALAYTVNLTGDFSSTDIGTLDANTSKTVTFTVTPQDPKTYHVSVDSLSGSFVCTSTPHGDIQLSNLIISPETCMQNQQGVYISCTAYNAGSTSETMGVGLQVVGRATGYSKQDTKPVTLAAGATATVKFEYDPTVADTFDVTLDGLTGSFVVNPIPAWQGWTPDTVVTAIYVSPDTIYLGQTAQINVDINAPWPTPATIQATIAVDGTTISKVFNIDIPNPELVFTYTPTQIGTFTATAQDKSATFTVLANEVGTFYSPFGGHRMPFPTDIVIPNVPAFIARHGSAGDIIFQWPGGDLKWSELIAGLRSSAGWAPWQQGGKVTFIFWTFEGVAWPVPIASLLQSAQPITWDPDDAVISTYAMTVGDLKTDHITTLSCPYVSVLATAYVCNEYWDSKDELATVIANYPRTAITDWVKYPGIQTGGYGYHPYGREDFWIKCPYCGTEFGVYNIDPADFAFMQGYLKLAREVLEHIESDHPDHPLTEPAWF